MQSIDDKILARVRGKGRGCVFFSTDFTLLGESKSVLKAIERLVTRGDILRVARGIYCYPKIDKRWGLGVLRPTYDEIAQAIARRDKLAFTNKLAMLITFALKEIGADNVTPEQEQTIMTLLQNETKESVMSDLALMPEWISLIVRRAYDK